jgi:hypothetical protein
MSRRKADEAKSTKHVKEDLTNKPVDTKKPQLEKKKEEAQVCVFTHVHKYFTEFLSCRNPLYPLLYLTMRRKRKRTLLLRRC